MKYTVLTARHHDGFALFDDPGSNFTSMKSAAHRDFVADYVNAVRKAGLHVGLYYSPLDWRYPGFFFPGIYRPSAEELRAQYHRQLNQLASNYGKIDILWFDGGGGDWLGFGGVTFQGGGVARRPKGNATTGSFSWQDDQAVGNLRKLQPSVILNDRTDAAADFRSREGDGALGDFENRYPWELCTTITDGPWGYDPNAKIKSLDHLIRLFVSAVGRDGNFILNVGPRADGQIDPPQAERLREIGAWLRSTVKASMPRAAALTFPEILASQPIAAKQSISISSIPPARLSAAALRLAGAKILFVSLRSPAVVASCTQSDHGASP